MSQTFDPTPAAHSPLPRRTIDASLLPDHAFSERSCIWWGNTLMLLIESSTMAILLATYFYLRMNFQQWPPPKVDSFPPILHPVPGLGVSTFNFLLLAASAVVMVWTHKAALRKDRPKVLAGLGVMLLAGLLITFLRYREFPATRFWWNDNAYASIVWIILGMHLIYSLAGALEFLVMGAWILTHGLDDNHALDVTLAGIYWYWVVGTGVIVYVVVYWGARLL
jgi:cytochrome c oxidase subunit 3